MIISKQNTLLYIEPTTQKSETPVMDTTTRKMAAAYAHQRTTGVLDPDGNYETGGSTMGFQRCVCGATSDPVDYELESGYITNSLCVHYLAWHRNEVPESELTKVNSLPGEEIEPTPDLLK